MPLIAITISVTISQKCDIIDLHLANLPTAPGPHDVAANIFACCILFTAFIDFH